MDRYYPYRLDTRGVASTYFVPLRMCKSDGSHQFHWQYRSVINDRFGEIFASPATDCSWRAP